MIKIQVNNNIYICSRDIERFNDLEEEVKTLAPEIKGERIIYFIDEDGDKVVLRNDNDLNYFKSKYISQKIKVEQKIQNNERKYNREIVKDAMKQKIMNLLQQY